MILSLRRYWRLLMTYLFPHWAQALVMATLLFAGIACQLLGPQVLRSFLDTAVAGGALSVLVASALLFLGVTLLTQVLAVAGTYVAESVGWLATNALRADVALHCLRLDPGFHQGRTPGELVERIDGDITTLATFFSRFVVDIVGSAILLGGVLVLLGREDWRLALATAGFAGVILAVMLRLYATARPIWVAVEQASATFFGLLQEYLGGTEDIRSCGAEGHAMRRFAERLRGWLPLLLRATFAEQAVWMAALSLFALANAVALATGVQLLRAGMITIGTVYLIAQYVELLIRPISRLQAQIQDLQKVGASITRVEELLQTRSVLPPGAGVPLPPGALPVTFDRVSFAYPAPGGSPPRVLHELSLHLEPGTVLGVLGRTGSGKSTLARLLLRFFDPQQGRVCLGGVDLRRASLEEVRRRVGLVTQEVQLFQATVRENLTFFDDTVPDERLRDVARELGLGTWLAGLPQGLDTPLAARGGGLSAGEGQLLALMRVFLKDAGLIVLDEASSRLDPATEALVEGAVDRLLRGGEAGWGAQPSATTRTAIVIAHRLATVQRADQVLVLEAGRVVEHGQRLALAADPTSHFARLMRAVEQGVRP